MIRETRMILLLVLAMFFAGGSSSASAQTVSIATSLSIRPLQRIYNYGQSCTGAKILSDHFTVPDLGSVWIVKLAGGPANTPVQLLVGNSNTFWGGNPLPYSLGPLGAPGCYMLTSANTVYSATTDALGAAQIAIPIPNNPALDKTWLYGQWKIPTTANPYGYVLTGAIAGQIFREINLRSVIGATSALTNNHPLVDTWNGYPAAPHYLSVPVPVTGSDLMRLKRYRLVGGMLGAGGMSGYGPYRFSVWSSLSAAQSSYTSGDIFNALIPAPTSGPTVFGAGPTADGLTYEMSFDLLPYMGGLVLQPNATYYIGMSITTLGSAVWGTSETATACPSDTLVGYGWPSGYLLNTTPGWTTGCVAVDIVATRK